MIGGQVEGPCWKSGKRSLARKSTAAPQTVQLMYTSCSSLT
ncbi:hypothetical protein [Priestia megaterium]|nr:hypothetical protein [Priestia megaterium]